MDLLLSRCIGRVVETDATEDSTAMHALHCAKLPTEDPILTSIYWIQKPKQKTVPYLDACILRPTKNPMIGGSSLGAPISLLSKHSAHPELIGIPRYLGLSLFGRPAKDRRIHGPSISVTFQQALFAHQIEVTNRCLDVLRTWGGATLIADCGVGKTGMALYLLSQLQTKTCILCNRTVLMDQWHEAIDKFLGPSVSVGTLQGTAKIDTSADIVVASIDTVINLRRDDVKDFGLVIVDEMHHIAAASLVHAVPLFSAKYTLGLTATPTRSDGLEHALYWLVGPAACVYQRVPELTGKRGTVIIRKLLFTEGLQKEIIYFNGTLGFSAMITELCQDPKRNALLRSLIEWSLEHRHRIVVVTSLVSHAQELRSKDGLPYPESALMAGTSKNRQEAKDAKIIFATYSMLEEGYDDPSLDTLILATPRSNVQQTIGRIERECPGKQVPLVFDLVDSFSLYPNMYWKRNKFYVSRGFTIETS